jgi:hypothetical protein
MSKSIAGAVLAVVVAALVGCAGSHKSASTTHSMPSASVAPANVDGLWSGALVCGLPVRLTLKQTGTSVTGDINVGGRADLDGPITGKVQGNTITLDLKSGYATAPLLNVKGDQITGTVAGTTLNLQRVR